MCNFRVGQKVVYVDDGIDYLGESTNLSVGRVYTVEAIVPAPMVVGLVVSGAYSWHHTKAYRSDRFRPVVERGTEKGMTILRNLLNKTGKPVKVDA